MAQFICYCDCTIVMGTGKTEGYTAVPVEEVCNQCKKPVLYREVILHEHMEDETFSGVAVSTTYPVPLEVVKQDAPTDEV